MATLNIKRLNTLPDPVEASTIYITKSVGHPDHVDITIVGTNVAEVRRIPSIADIESAINYAVNNLSVSQIPDLPGSKITSAVAEATHADAADHASTATLASAATKLNTARNINGVPFDGSQNITINAVDSTARVAVSDIGVTVAPLSNGVIPAEYLPNGLDNLETFPTLADFPATGSIDTIYIAEDTNVMYRWPSVGSAYIAIPSGVSHSDTTGKLLNAVQISLNGHVTGTATFDGSTDIEIIADLNEIIDPGIFVKVSVDATGRVVEGWTALGEADIPNISGDKITSKVAEAYTADAWSTGRTLYVGGDVAGNVTFDGSANIELMLTGNGDTGSGIKLAYENGMVTGALDFTAADVPDLPGSKITSAVAEATHAVTADSLTITASW